MASPSAQRPDRNLAMELVRVTESAALAAARWVGRGHKEGADAAAVDAMRLSLSTVQMTGTVIIGEGEKDDAPMLYNGERIGDGTDAKTDIAVDPIEMKREFAQTMGATHAVASIEEATPLVQELSWGRGANQVIITVGDATSDLFAPAMGMVGKGGSLTLTSLSNMMQNDISLNTVDFAMSGKHLHGSIYGYCNPRADIPKLLRLYDQGKLKLDELVTQKYALEDINEGYRALHDGEIIRGLIDFSL